MGKVVDARGLSCPQPVMMAIAEMKKSTGGELEVLVDTDTAKENVSRAAQSNGWTVIKIKETGGEYSIRIKKQS